MDSKLKSSLSAGSSSNRLPGPWARPSGPGPGLFTPGPGLYAPGPCPCPLGLPIGPLARPSSLGPVVPITWSHNCMLSPLLGHVSGALISGLQASKSLNRALRPSASPSKSSTPKVGLPPRFLRFGFRALDFKMPQISTERGWTKKITLHSSGHHPSGSLPCSPPHTEIDRIELRNGTPDNIFPLDHRFDPSHKAPRNNRCEEI